MTPPDVTLHPASALVAERARYESWLFALEERREHAPPHVYERVRRDYEERLALVGERLGAHVSALAEEASAAAARLAELDADLAAASDERAEAELRAHVGELSGDEWDAARNESEAALSGIRADRDRLLVRLEGLEALLRSIRTDPRTGMETRAEPIGDDEAPEHMPPPGLDSAPPRRRVTLDELATMADETAANDAVGEGSEQEPATVDGQDIRADDSPSTAARPRLVRTPAHTDAPRILRCGECGTMNIPTEWYCDRCGAELAVL